MKESNTLTELGEFSMKKAKSAFQRLADRIVNTPKPEYVNTESSESYDIQEILARNSKEFKDSRKR